MHAVNLQLFSFLNLGPGAWPWLVKLAIFASTVLPEFLVSASIAAIAIGQPRWRVAGVQATLGMALGLLIARLLASMFDSARPFAVGLGHQWLAHAPTPGFPSTHAAVAAAFAAAVWLGKPALPVRWMALVAALLIGWSRVAAGVHFPADVFLGFVVGAACGWAAVHLIRCIAKSIRQRWPDAYGHTALLTATEP